MNYEAIIAVDHGVRKFGGPADYDDTLEKTYPISANSDANAILNCRKILSELADDHFSTTDGYTTSTLVRLLRARDPNQLTLFDIGSYGEVNQEEAYAKALTIELDLPAESQERILQSEIIQGKLRIRRSELERILKVLGKEKVKEFTKCA